MGDLRLGEPQHNCHHRRRCDVKLGVLVLLLNMRAEIAELRWDLNALGDRIARIGVDSMSITGRGVSEQEVMQ